jgi:hypothetical protein
MPVLFSDTMPPIPRKERPNKRENFVQEQLQISIELPVMPPPEMEEVKRKERGVVIIDVF